MRLNWPARTLCRRLKHCVKVDFDARRQEISDGLEEMAVAEDTELKLDLELLDEVSARCGLWFLQDILMKPSLPFQLRS